MPKAKKPSSKSPAASVQTGEGGVGIGGDVTASTISVVNQQVIEKQLAAARFTIPPPVTDFTGRENELAQLKASFQRGAVISGVTGGGGIGKTELARKLAQEIANDYPDARLEINLLGTAGKPLPPEDAMRRLLEPFHPNQKLPDDPNLLRGLYQQTFAQNKALLLLDNAANAAQARPLIPPGPSAAIVTSRLHFSLSEYGLNPLRLDVLSETDAVLLLRASCGKMKETSEQEALELARLCGRLPLALRVAASILTDSPNWTAQTLISRLKDERTRLARLKRDSDPGLDVEAVLRLSYNLLDDDLKARFRQLSVFPAPFLMLSAQAVWELTDAAEADDLLGKLINRSLVNLTASSSGRVGGRVSIHPSDYSTAAAGRVDASEASAVSAGRVDASEASAVSAGRVDASEASAVSAGRVDASEASAVSRPAVEFFYSLHDLTRLFAYEKLQENEAEARAAILRHARHFLERASAADDLYQKGGENILPALAAFRFLYPHLEAAFDRLSARQGDPEADRWLSDFPGKCAYALDLHLPPRQKIPLLEHALAASRRLKDKNAEGVHLGNLGLAYAALGEARKAIEFYEKQLVIVREIGDRRGEGNALGNLGLAYAALGEARKAIEFYEKQLVIVREIGDRRGEGNALGNLGLAYADLGEARKAIEFYEQALVIDREIGDRRGEGADLGNLGLAYADLGEARKAIEFYEQALVIDREIGDRRGEGADLANMGLAYKNLGEKEKARKLWQEALAIFRAIESPHGKTVEGWLEGL